MSPLTTRLESTSTGTPQRDLAIEGLRGGAALAVLHAHLFSPVVKDDGGGALDPAYAPPSFFYWLEGGSLAVLLFFLLSGYVIGLSISRPFTVCAIPAFLRRRAIRILPIYLAAIGLGAALSPVFPIQDALGHLLFLQNSGDQAFIKLLSTNPSLWSLPYEAVFYLIFPLLWFWRPRIIPLLLTCCALCALATLRPSAMDFPAAILGRVSEITLKL
jgi:peptidoglycan/LPS O-acetylase OafA/YrhL